MSSRRVALWMVACAAILLGVLPLASAHAAPAPGTVIVLVSGFDTVTPFSTSAAACAGKEGPAWNPATGIARALKTAGHTVFTAPVKNAGKPAAPPCAPGTPVPPVATTYINSNGDVNQNGQQLGRFFAFLRDNYNVKNIALVAHSDGGLWSRSAITQSTNYANVAVSSLTTLGTPHTGSFVADLAEDLNNGQCDASNFIVQEVCKALLRTVQFVVNDLGPATTEELTSDYLTTWNPEQRIGGCPVTGIGGTYINLPIPDFLLPRFYNPSDGLVGEAAALGRASTTITGTAIPAPGIPGFVVGGTYPVVHGDSFEFLDKNNLLNQTAISNNVVSILNAQSATAPPCSTTAPATLTDGVAAATVPLRSFAVPVNALFPVGRRSDRILSNRAARLSCGSTRLGSTPFLGRTSLRVTLARACSGRIRAQGGRALMIRSAGSASVAIRGSTLTVKTGGVAARSVVAHLKRGTRFSRIQLSSTGRGTLPAGSGRTTVRVSVTTRGGQRYAGSATVSR